ncbi:MAG: polysaccharide deacetylase family protein [Pseudomonadota bacterium]
MTDGVIDPNLYSPPRSLLAKVERRWNQWRTAKALSNTPSRAIISFTFDDFPKSAAQNGADILDRFHAHGAYYTCTGFVDQEGPFGPYYTLEDMRSLADAGHEIAAHTQTHINCSKALQANVLSDIDENLNALCLHNPTQTIRHFAYPYGETRLALKNALSDRFETGRGVLPGINRRGTDLMQLRAVELNMDADSIRRAERMIEAAVRSPGWLIFFTHDVQNEPSAFGVTPKTLERIVRQARDSGAYLTTPSGAMAEINAVAA